MTMRWLLKGFVTGRRAARDTRGATVVEFAFVAPVFLMFLIGIIDFGRLLWVKSTMQYVVEQTARYAMVNPSTDEAVFEAALETQASTIEGGMISNVTYTAALTSESKVVGTETITIYFVAISATHDFTFLIPLVDLGPLTIQAKSYTAINDPS